MNRTSCISVSLLLLSTLLFSGFTEYRIPITDYLFPQTEQPFLELSGYVCENEVSAVRLEGVKVTVYEDNRKVSETTTKPDGVFIIKLLVNSDYTIEFSKSYFIGKKISVNTAIESCTRSSYKYETGVSLFKFIEGIRYDILDRPEKQIVCDEKKCKFTEDALYTETIRAQQKELLDEITVRQKLLVKEMKKMNDAEKEEFEKKRRFAYEQYMIVKSEQKTTKKSFKTKSNEISDQQKAENERQRQLTLRYDNMISQADDKFERKEYELARISYEYAYSLRPEDHLPRHMIAVIDSLLKVSKKEVRYKSLDLEKIAEKEKQENKVVLAAQAEKVSKEEANQKIKKQDEAMLERMAQEMDLKTIGIELEREKELIRTSDMESLLAKASRKRILLEEIADSKMAMKKAGGNR